MIDDENDGNAVFLPNGKLERGCKMVFIDLNSCLDVSESMIFTVMDSISYLHSLIYVCFFKLQ